jgi:hypothetical protein
VIHEQGVDRFFPSPSFRSFWENFRPHLPLVSRPINKERDNVLSKHSYT